MLYIQAQAANNFVTCHLPVLLLHIGYVSIYLGKTAVVNELV